MGAPEACGVSEAGANDLRAEGVACRQGAFEIRASFRAPSNGVTVVFGPSGAGKSTLLKSVAGLFRLDAGVLRLGEEVLEDANTGKRMSAHRRDIGLVFQDARLFPHLTVAGNLRFAARRVPDRRAAPAIADVAAQVEIDHLLDRSVGGLSGGERSRVALARALVSAPRLLLLDEPFAALDGRLRRSFIRMLGGVARKNALPMMVVTHLIDDAVELADSVIAMREGSVLASGAAADMFARDEFRALLDRRDTGTRLGPDAFAGGDRIDGKKGVWLRADNVLVAVEEPKGLSARNVWRGKLQAIVDEAEGSVLLSLACDVGEVLARVTRAAVGDLQLSPGQDIWAVVKTHAV